MKTTALKTSKVRNVSPFLSLALGLWMAASVVAADDSEKTAGELATLFRAARKVISENQPLINDAEKGDKGLSASTVVSKTKENFQAAAGKPVDEKDANQTALLAAVAEVMTDAQPLINEKGKGFKGFLPAIFARQVAEKTSAKLSGKVTIKLTAPKDYLRNRANRPDEWETNVIESKFRAAGWEKGKQFSERAPHKGQDALRLMLPEYYNQSCLACHGDPKGGRDITGGIMEGAKLDEVGGAISVVIYVK